MAGDEFEKVELPAIEQLQSLGWSYVKGEDLSPDNSNERASLKEVVLEDRLCANIKNLIPGLMSKTFKKLSKT